MLREQPRQVTSPYSEPSSQCGDAVLVESPGFDHNQSPLDRGPCALPRRAERGGFRPTTKARPVSRAFRCGCAWVENNIARKWRPYPADRSAIDTGCFDRHEHHIVQGRVAALQSQVTGLEINHALLATRTAVLMRAGDDDQVRKRRLVLGITHAVRNCKLAATVVRVG